MHLQKTLIDTDILIDFLRKKETAKRLLENALQTGDLYLSVVTVAELLAGMKLSEAAVTEDLISGFTLITVSESIARRAGALRRRHSRVLLPDCLIAATALEENCTLLTGNRKDYPFEGIQFFS
ncbi:MAG: type II toxin-antitoxin system VapC family toxin [Deltaproteobacteria bacterium]|nr:type II toxin-antitoxin system VapC family toxin [Deltaproteobacteria bacterium]